MDDPISIAQRLRAADLFYLTPGSWRAFLMWRLLTPMGS